MTDINNLREFYVSLHPQGSLYYAWENKQVSKNPDFKQILVREVIEGELDEIENLRKENEGLQNAVKNSGLILHRTIETAFRDEDNKYKSLCAELADCLEKAKCNWASKTSNWVIDSDKALAKYRKSVEEK